jgi:hypothetical protein
MAIQVFGTQATAIQLYMAFYGGAPSNSIYNNFVSVINASGAPALAQVIGSSFSSLSNSALATSVLTNIGITPATTNASAYAALQSALSSAYAAFPATARGQITLNLMGLLDDLEGNATYGSAAVAFNNATAANLAFASDPDNTLPSTTPTLALTTGLDNVMGTAADNTFNARVVQNVNGEQTNQLATGDQINGGAGNDTLLAKVIEASPLNDGPQMAITPETTDLEHVLITALSAGNSSSEEVVLNAKFMNGLDRVGSVQSDASLLVTNLTTLTDSGLYADRRNTETVVIRMDHTGNGDAEDVESDLTVLFDQDYLVSGVSSNSQAFYFLLDEKAELIGSANRLNEINIDGLRFTVNGGAIVEISSAAALTAGTHAAFVAALQAPLAAAIAAGLVPAGTTITLDASITDFTFLDNGARSGAIPAIVLTAGGGATVDPVGFSQVEDLLGSFDVYGAFTDVFASEVLPVTATIQLEKVGRGSDGGDLTVGGMSTDGTNTWDSGSGSKGIEQFNITVSGDATQNSSLASLQSTNNTLEVVNVTSATGSVADLRIGNSATDGDLGAILAEPVFPTAGNVILPSEDNQNALKDVRVFNAAGLTGDLTLFAALTDEVTAKYMNLVDAAPATPAADNVSFVYTGGAGNDYINLWMSDANLAAAGTTAREDFVLVVNGGAGNDEIVTRIGDGTSGAGPDNWYANSKINANLTINAGAGDDVVRTLGAGDFVINAEAGNDTVYADNTGAQAVVFNDGRATYIFNASNLNVDDLLSQGAATQNAVNANLTVTFRGITSTAVIANSADSLVNVAITDLAVNQAIKAAINGDAELSKLLVAEDGPGRTLIVRSLIDGTQTTADLAVTFGTTGVLSAAQLASLPVPTLFAAAAGLSDGYVTTFGQSAAVNIVGADSTSASDNIITGGTGDDVIVLGTTEGATALLASNDTVRYVAGAFGNDTVVNFGANTIVDAGVAGVAGVAEVFTATFAGSETGGDTTVAFDGVTSTLAAAAGGVALAADFVADYNAVAAATWVAVANGDGTVTFTSKLAGARADIASAAFVVTPVTADAVAVTVTAAAPTTQGVTAVAAVAAINDADLFDFRGLGGDISTQGDLTTLVATDKSIFVVAETAATDTAAEVKVALDASVVDDATASTHVYVAYDAATNIADVYTVVDSAADNDTVVTLVGTIDLADTPWNTLTVANFV